MYSLTNNPQLANANIGFFTVKHVLTDDDIQYLNKLSQLNEFNKAKLYNDTLPDLNIRNNSIFWIEPERQSEQINTIFKKIRSILINVNETAFQFSLTDMEPIQYTRYNLGDFYKSHIDMDDDLLIGNTCRKLSFSIQITDPSEYIGGELLAYAGQTPITASKEKGSMTLFPSFMLHEVKPVTQGVRNALVGWCWGPKFK